MAATSLPLLLAFWPSAERCSFNSNLSTGWSWFVLFVSSINLFLLNKPTCDGCRGLNLLVMSPAVSGDVYRGLPLASACSLVAVHTYRQSLLIGRCLSLSLLPSSARCALPQGHCNRRVERPKASPRPWLLRPRSSQPPPDQPPPPAQSRRGPH